MKLTVKYDARVDSLTIDAGEDVHIAVSSCVEDCLVGDFGSESRTDVVGIELLAARKLLAQYCAGTEPDARQSRKAAEAIAPLKVDYDKEGDILAISTGRSIDLSYEVELGFIAHLGYARESRSKKYSVIGFELHNASECLAPWFKLNRAPLTVSGADSD